MNVQLAAILLATVSINLHGAQVNLPDPLTLSNGKKVVSTQDWRKKRRPEVLELFRQHVYGRAPLARPRSLKFEVVEETRGVMDGKATRKQINISFRGRGGQGVIHVLLFVPTGTRKPAPCFLLINNRGPENADPQRLKKSEFWPAEEIIARGYASAVFQVSDVDPDTHDGFKNGVHGIFDAPGPRSPDAWATIGAWAWGASRVMDYLQTDRDINPRRVALVGHSRGGKTSLWAGAQDERFAMVVSNNSGSTGAALSRRKQGETIAIINRGYPHWFNENYKRYNGKEAELPIDQHLLLALIAPRLLYVSSATEDGWSDPEAEFKSAVAAQPVYQLFGLTGLQSNAMPAPESPLQEGHIGYHLRTGKHTMNSYDWGRFMDFADRHFAQLK